jgi:hypothetical protein
MLNVGKHMRYMDTRGDVSSTSKGLSIYKGYMEYIAWIILIIVGERGL